jgi:hypothetical protein
MRDEHDDAGRVDPGGARDVGAVEGPPPRSPGDGPPFRTDLRVAGGPRGATAPTSDRVAAATPPSAGRLRGQLLEAAAELRVLRAVAQARPLRPVEVWYAAELHRRRAGLRAQLARLRSAPPTPRAPAAAGEERSMARGKRDDRGRRCP